MSYQVQLITKGNLQNPIMVALERQQNTPIVLVNMHVEGEPVLSWGSLAEAAQLGISGQCS